MAEPVTLTAPAAARPDPALRTKLSLMMFLQYAIWGAWAPILTLHLKGLAAFQFADGAPNFGLIGLIYMTMPIASIIAPFLGGQIADRYFAAQKFLAISQFVGGAVLLVVARFTGLAEVFVGMLLYNLIYSPTIALSNSISFQHWPNQQFGKIRAWGSIGWIVIGWVFGFWLGAVSQATMGHCLYMAAILSFVYGLFAFALPHTPPKKGSNPLAFLDAVGMLRKPAFAVMAAISFFVAIELQYYFILTPGFLNESGGPFEAQQVAQYWSQQSPERPKSELDRAAQELVARGDKNGDKKLSRAELAELGGSDPHAKAFSDAQDQQRAAKGGIGLDQARVSQVMTFGQICEMVMMVLLPLAVRKLGFRLTMAVGIAAWALRDLTFAIGHPAPLVISAIALHGIGFAFFFTTIFMFADVVAPKDIKSSAQGFLGSVTIGCGMLVGSLLAGPVPAACAGDWHKIYLVPAILCAVCCVAFLLAFRPKETTQSA